MSSLGTNSRPTSRLSGTVSRAVTTEIEMMAIGWSSAQFTCRVYHSSSQWKNPRSFVLRSRSASDSFRNRELSIGVRVKLTSIDTMIANAIVQPNGLMNRLAYPLMNAIGRKITTSDSVVAMTASATSRVPSIAASKGEQPFSSMYLKMFSSTTIASSMTMPTASVIPRRVMLFSVNPMMRISVNDAMIEAGMATAEMSTARRFRMKNITTIVAKSAPKIRCSSSDAIDA